MKLTNGVVTIDLDNNPSILEAFKSSGYTEVVEESKEVVKDKVKKTKSNEESK